MQPQLVPADRSTVRANPHAGRTAYPIAGRPRTHQIGDMTLVVNEIQYVYSLSPEPAYFYEHVPTRLACGCEVGPLHTDVEHDEVGDGEGGEIPIVVCPVCREVVAFTLERLTDQQCKEALDGAGEATQAGRAAAAVQDGGQAEAHGGPGHVRLP